ncbi:methyl-CpG-binding domain protein 6-like [Carassius carassius]|uniref:methyl-CpG-binding domain protein 6-like n=1 Tax=Carassius carassius TaxID=217509 RepID=UPI0028691712|nr:methyl-CpG-binding domain protein 6-like [Carassius carassius]XP_059426327.1 methyl-CpG-binding domain protein 6-like [Carassius carassius]XP_059426328.1 methyl-CpG-binding domain protein 6-like [Carassius carassius]XP_059426329.1 methyl-CpG-binding domain protein 6-like [Carassius carassius]
MTGGSESAAGEKDGGTMLIAQIPVGWQRKVEDGAVSYISPSGTVLRSVDEARVYLRTDGTCKCGLECPLVPNKVFNFDPAAMVRVPGHQSGKIEEDMTKLCNHRRKVDAMAALCQSMQPSHLPSLAQATGGVIYSVDSREPRGSMVAHGDGVHCTYPQPRHNHPIGFPLSSPRSVVQNGSVGLPPVSRPPEQCSPLKKPQTPVGCMPGYAKQQWSPHPPLSQNIPQRTSPNSVHKHKLPPDPSNAFSLSPSSSLTLSGRGAPPNSQGASVKSPSPLSPSRTLDNFSARQRSRHSSTSSLSEHGVQGSVFIQGGKPLQPTMPCSSPKLPLTPSSPCSRLEGILQHYKDCSTSSGANQSNHQMSLVHPNPGDKRNGLSSAQATGLLGLPLGQILNQQKSQQKGHITNSFPASSLLSAAAKAQVANQKTQLNAADALTALPLTALDKEQQSKVLISTLNSSVHPTSARAQSLTALLLPHSTSLSPASPAVTEKNLRRKRQRRSPTVINMLKDTQLGWTAEDLSGPPLLISPCLSPSSPSAPHLDNHRLSVAPPNASRLQDSEEGRKPGLANSLPSPSQPLSALLQLLSMQSATQQSGVATAMPSNRHTNTLPSSPRPITPQTPQCDMQSTLRLPNHTPQPQPQSTVPMPEPTIQRPPSQPFPLMGDETTMNLKTTSSNAILNLSQTPSDLNSSILSMMNQISSTCLPSFPEKGCGSKTTDTCLEHGTFQIKQSNHNQAVESKGPIESMDQPDVDARLLGGCEPDHSLSLPNAPSSDLSNPTTDPHVSLAEAFPFMSQEQLLQLLSSNAGLPSLLPPFLSSLPLGVWMSSQPSVPGGAQAQPTSVILNQGSPLNVLNQGELPINLVSLLNPPGTAAAEAEVEGGEKPPGLQALLMASLLLGQNPAAMLPLPALNLELPTLQQVFADGVSLEKTPALLDSVLMGPGLLEALQTLAPSADGQSLLLSTHFTPPPHAFLSLNPALLTAALAQTEPLPNHPPSPPPHSQGTLSSPALVSTSVSCGPLVSSTEVCYPLAEQDKNNTQTPHFLPPLLAPGVLGHLTALGNISSLHGLLGAGPLLLPQGPLTQNQTALNPLTCLQLTMAPGLMGEKPVALHETPSSQDQLPSASISQDSLLNPVQQRETSTGSGPGLFDPYGSFMDTIYTSFLQVNERDSYPELPPPLSPRRACSVHNPDLTRLGLDTARGTPKPSEDPSPPPPPCDAPLEEAKTDGSATVYSNGIVSGAEGRGGEEEEDGRRPQGYLSPGERLREGVEDIRDAEQVQAEDVHTGARRGRKRKQSLQRGADLLGGIDEPMMVLSRSPRSVRGKRRRVVR